MALAELDVLVVPSKLDGRPNVIMEANACGIPVIGAPIGGIPELIQHGCNGFLFRPDEFHEISKVVNEWVKDITKYKEYQIACRVIAEKLFDRERMLSDYEAVFLRLLRN
jgi:glycosyltransferase involved in cell wall biosynthesis